MKLRDFLSDESGASLIDGGVALGALSAVSYAAYYKLNGHNADILSWMANMLPGGEHDETGAQQLVKPAPQAATEYNSEPQTLTNTSEINDETAESALDDSYISNESPALSTLDP